MSECLVMRQYCSVPQVPLLCVTHGWCHTECKCVHIQFNILGLQSFFLFFFFLPSVWPLHHWAVWLIHIILCTISFSFPDLVLASVPFRIFEESYSNSMSLHVCRVIVISQMQIKCFYLWAWDLVSQMKLFYDHIVQLSFLIWELVE